MSDFVMAATGLWLVSIVKSVPPNVESIALMPFAAVLIAKLLGLYDNDSERLRHGTIDEIGRIATCVLVIGLVGTFWSELIYPGNRAIAFVLVTSTIIVGRAIARRVVVASTPAERCLLIGSDHDAELLSRRFERAHTFNAVIVDQIWLSKGMLSDTKQARRQLRELVASHRAERVIVVPTSQDHLDSVRALTTAGIKVSISPHFLEVVGSSWVVDDLGGMNLFGVKQPGLNRSSLAIKRAFDLVLSIPGTLLVLPLMLLIAIAIRLDSRGPAIFRQRRVGQFGHEFTMYKFRTMEVGAHKKRSILATLNEADAGLFKITDDPRVTRVGKLLRKTSLDELPQILNVILGSMSLVGPRPLIPDEDAALSGWARFREKVPPGMTGPWQIGGSSKIPIDEMAGLDYRYATDWSLWVDIKILLRTAVFMLGRRGR